MTVVPSRAGRVVRLPFVLLSLLPALAPAADFVPVTDAMLREPAAQDWPMWRRNYAGWGYSPLEQITADNVAQLVPAWSIALNDGVQEGTPLVYDGVLYMPHPGDLIQALDAASGELLWEHRRPLPDDLGDYIPAISTNRALAIYDDLILFTSNDDYIVALDARSGELRWETLIHDYRSRPAQQSSGPVVIEGLAISGRGCMPQGGPDTCVITAHDARSGEEVWRFHTIERPAADGQDSWGGLPWEQRWHVGAWMMPSYDPELGLLYMGTSVTAPAPKFLLAGNELDYLYHNSTLAIEPKTGRLRWHYQHLVDHWDLDHPFERLLVDTQVAPDPAEVPWINPAIEPGREYKVLTGIPGKTGVVYTLDRESGAFLWARPTVRQTVLASIDGTSGKATVNPAMLFSESGQSIEVCPSTGGGKNWWAGAYSPRSKRMFYALQNTCSDMAVTSEEANAEELYGIFGREKLAPGETMLGTVQAISAESGQRAWKAETRGTSLSLVATGGGLVFGGDIEGSFRAYDEDSGEVLWQVELGSAVTGYPVSFAVDGRQYIAVGTGSSVTTNGQQRLMPEGFQLGSENRLHVFALPQ